MKKIAIAIAAFASMSAGALIATAEAQMQAFTQENVPAPVCGERNHMVQTLQQQFREEPQAVGVVDKNAVIELFVSHTGSWTLLATGTDGNSCLVASGEGWDSQQMIVGVGA